MNNCQHQFTRFKQHGSTRTYTCDLCGMDIDGDAMDIIKELEAENKALLEANKRLIIENIHTKPMIDKGDYNE